MKKLTTLFLATATTFGGVCSFIGIDRDEKASVLNINTKAPTIRVDGSPA